MTTSALALHLEACALEASAAGKAEQAYELFKAAYLSSNDDPRLRYNLGTAALSVARPGEALSHFDAIVLKTPNHAASHSNRGVALQQLDRQEEAIASFVSALKLDPKFVDAYYNYGNSLYKLGLFDAAIVQYDEAIRYRHDHVDAYVAKGNALQMLQQFDQSERCYLYGLKISPTHHEARINLGMLQLLLGQFNKGWMLFEERLNRKEAKHLRISSLCRWMPTVDTSPNCVLIVCDEGFGDSIQFCRYLPILLCRGFELEVLAPIALRALLANSIFSRKLKWVSDLSCLSSTAYAPMLSLPFLFSTTEESIPNRTPYLRALESQVNGWQGLLGPKRSLRVGVAWRGSPGHQNDAQRSLPLPQLLAVLPLQIEAFCLQPQVPDSEYTLMASSAIRFVGEHIGDFSDTAALIECMDLVISVDTSVAHLAGALGKPTWVLLPFVPDWRWMIEREDSPWYPTMKLYRQPSRGDWASVLDRVRADLLLLRSQSLACFK